MYQREQAIHFESSLRFNYRRLAFSDRLLPWAHGTPAICKVSDEDPSSEYCKQRNVSNYKQPKLSWQREVYGWERTSDSNLKLFSSILADLGSAALLRWRFSTILISTPILGCCTDSSLNFLLHSYKRLCCNPQINGVIDFFSSNLPWWTLNWGLNALLPILCCYHGNGIKETHFLLSGTWTKF